MYNILGIVEKKINKSQPVFTLKATMNDKNNTFKLPLDAWT